MSVQRLGYAWRDVGEVFLQTAGPCAVSQATVKGLLCLTVVCCVTFGDGGGQARRAAVLEIQGKAALGTQTQLGGYLDPIHYLGK